MAQRLVGGQQRGFIMNGTNPGPANGESGRELPGRRLVEDMVDAGWLEDGPKLWRTETGGATLVDIKPGIAGSVHVQLGQHLSIDVDRLEPDRLTGFEVIGPQSEVSTAAWDTLRHIGGDQLVAAVSNGSEGLLSFALPRLPEDVQHLARTCTATESMHPIFALDAWAIDYQDPGTQRAAARLRDRAQPFVTVLSETLAGAETWAQVFELARALAASSKPVVRIQGSDRALGRDAVDVLLELAGGPRAQRELQPPDALSEWVTVPIFDLVEVDEVERAQFRVVDDTVEVLVDVEDRYEALSVVVADDSGELASAPVVFADGTRRGGASLMVSKGDFWVEVHGAEVTGRQRWERAADAASSAVARVVAILQAVGSVAAAGSGSTLLANELRVAAAVLDGPALDPVRAQQVVNLAADLESGVLPFQHRQATIAAQFVVEMQSALADLVATPLDFHDGALLRSLVADTLFAESADQVPDFVPIDWLIEQFPRTVDLPDKAPALSVNADEKPFRCELTDEQTGGTGITSIYVEFKDDVVTVTISRRRERAAYSLRILDASGQLEHTVSSNPVADLYVAHFEGGSESVRLEIRVKDPT
jgi:hypothetical protein